LYADMFCMHVKVVQSAAPLTALFGTGTFCEKKWFEFWYWTQIHFWHSECNLALILWTWVQFKNLLSYW